jgi:hypothetical protein
LNPDLLVPEADAMSIAPRRQGSVSTLTANDKKLYNSPNSTLAGFELTIQ